MLAKVTSYVKKLDQFDVVFQPNLTFSYKEYKTVLGGLMSILIYGLSLGFLIYNLVLWKTNSLLPKLTTIENIVDYKEYLIQDSIIQFSLRSKDNQRIDPFDPKALIFQPILYLFQNESPVIEKIQQLPFQEKESGFYTIELKNLSFTLSIYQDEERPQIEYYLAFGLCSNTSVFLPVDYICASREQIDQYFAQRLNAFMVSTYIKQYNTNSKQYQTIKKSTKVVFDNQTTYFMQNSLKTSTTTIDDGILFESNTISNENCINHIIDTYLIDIEQLAQTMRLDYFYKVFGYEIYILYNIKMGSLQQEQTIQFAKISEVLANTGSIVSLLLLLQYIVIMSNNTSLEKEALHSVIEMYYPKFKEFKIKQNLFGRIISVEQDNQQIDVKVFNQTYDQLKQIAQQKLSIANQIYEISRLQFIIQSLYSRDIIKIFHRVGLKMEQQVITQNIDQSNASNMQIVIFFYQLNQHPNSKEHLISTENTESELNPSDFSLLVWQQNENSILSLDKINEKLKKFIELNLIQI